MQLESDAKVDAEVINLLHVFIAGTCHDSTDFQDRAKQYSGFQTDHLDIFVKSDIVASLKIQIMLLTLTHLKCHLAKLGKHLLRIRFIGAQSILECLDKHGVARKQSDIGVPFVINCLQTATQRSFIHDIVVNKGEVMENLSSHCRCEAFLNVAAKHLA